MECSLNVHITKKEKSIQQRFHNLTFINVNFSKNHYAPSKHPAPNIIKTFLEYIFITWVMCLDITEMLLMHNCDITWREAGKEVLFLRLTAHLFTRECWTADFMYAAHVFESVFL